MLTKEQILSADDLKREKVSVPEWGGHVWIRVMSGAERDGFEQGIVQGNRTNLTNIRAKLAALTVCDENGLRLFTDVDVIALGKKSAAALDRIFAAAQRLNGISGKDVEELEKNSGSGLSAASGSDLQAA